MAAHAGAAAVLTARLPATGLTALEADTVVVTVDCSTKTLVETEVTTSVPSVVVTTEVTVL